VGGLYTGDEGGVKKQRGDSGSAKAIQAGREEFEELKVAEDLELLADFVGDVGVVGMEFS
jgi:hypothetical protein